jgi:hypothetical protein
MSLKFSDEFSTLWRGSGLRWLLVGGTVRLKPQRGSSGNQRAMEGCFLQAGKMALVKIL